MAKLNKNDDLITLDNFYNNIGRSLYSDWSNDTIQYLFDVASRKKFQGFAERAKNTQKVARDKILSSKKMLQISFSDKQGFIDPPFEIYDINFPRSLCSDENGRYYHCKVAFRKENRGRKSNIEAKQFIENFINNEIALMRVLVDQLTNKQTVLIVQEAGEGAGFKEGFSESTVIRRLRELKLVYTQNVRMSK